VNGQAGVAAVCFELNPLWTLNALQGFADRVRLAAEQFQLCAFAEVGACFIGPAEPTQHQAAVVKRPRVATAALNRGVERIEGAADVAGKEGMHAATVELFEHGVLREAGRRRKSQ